MHKISNFTGQARHGWERMAPTFGRPQQQPPQQQQQQQPQDMNASHSFRRPPVPPTIPTPPTVDTLINLSFNVPFSSNLPGPDPEDVLHSSPGALQRWTFPDGTPEGTPIHKLPVHASHVDALRKLCRQISESSGGRIEATVTSTEPKALATLQRRPQGLVTNVCVSGENDVVHKMRAKILTETPFALVRSDILQSLS